MPLARLFISTDPRIEVNKFENLLRWSKEGSQYDTKLFIKIYIANYSLCQVYVLYNVILHIGLFWYTLKGKLMLGASMCIRSMHAHNNQPSLSNILYS